MAAVAHSKPDFTDLGLEDDFLYLAGSIYEQAITGTPVVDDSIRQTAEFVEIKAQEASNDEKEVTEDA